MNKKEAVSILEEQINKLDDDKNHNYNWFVETKTYIDSFLGKDSHQSDSLKNRTFNQSSKIGISKEENINNIKTSVRNCINVINNIGLYKKPKKNFLSSIPDSLLVLIFSTIGFVGFTMGKYTSDVKNFNQEQEIIFLNKEIDSIRKASLLISKPPDSKTSKAKNDTINKKK